MKTKPRSRKRGYALVTVMGIMIVMGATFTLLLKSSEQSVYMGNIIEDRTRASAYAEAGIEFAYAVLRDDFTKRTNITNFLYESKSVLLSGTAVKTTYGEGSYTLTLTTLNNGQYVIVNSVGTCGNSSDEVEVVCEDSNYQEANGFDYLIFGGGGNMTHRIGGGTLVDGDGNTESIHFNGDLNNSGNSDTEANVSLTGTASDPDSITGSLQENQSSIATPKLEERYNSFAWYQQNADETYDGDYTLKNNKTDSIDGGDGILFVNGDVTISGTFKGTIIATGSLSVKGSLIAGDTGIAFATQNGDIQFNTKSDCSGLFYSETGDFQQTAQGVIEGQIVVGGHFKSTGGSDITLPSGEESIEVVPNPVIAAWQK